MVLCVLLEHVRVQYSRLQVPCTGTGTCADILLFLLLAFYFAELLTVQAMEQLLMQ